MAALRTLLLAVLAAIALAHPALAQTFPELTGPVIDQAQILPPESEARLTEKLTALKLQTQRELVVVTLKSLEGYEISDYGYRLGRHWQLGTKDTNQGAILIVAPNERKLRIEVGYGLEPVLTDGMSSLIINQQIVPRFKAGDMPGGIEAGTDAIIRQLALPADQAAQAAAAASARPAKQKSEGIPLGLIIWMIFFFLFFVLPIIRRARRGRHYRGSGIGPVIVWDVINAASHASRSSGGWGSSGGGGGGGGISWGGGGGSFGGGGASGSW